MKIKKIIILITLLITISSVFLIGKVQAAETGTQTATGGNFDSDPFETDSYTVPAEVENFTNNTLGTAISIARIVSTGIAIITLMVVACKYMMAAPGDRADIKKHAVPYVIGACVVFGAASILGIIVDFASSLTVGEG